MIRKILTVILFQVTCLTVVCAQVADATERAALANIAASLNLTATWTPALIAQYPAVTLQGVVIENGDIVEIDFTPTSIAMSGTIHPDFNLLTALRKIIIPNSPGSFPGRYISGTLPNLGALVNLKTLNISRNRMTGTIGSWIGNLDQLEYLYLGSDFNYGGGQTTNRMTGPLPASFSSLPALKEFDFSSNNLSYTASGCVDPFPADMYLLANLKKLILNQCVIFTGSNCQSTPNPLLPLTGITSLTYLDLAGNNIPQLPPQFNQLSAMEFLSVSSNPFGVAGEPSLAALSGLSNLKELHLNNCALESIPANLHSGTTALEILWLSSNAIHIVPDNLDNFTTLKTLYLDNNPINDPLPSWFGAGNMPTLNHLYLSNCGIKEPIPTNFFSMTALQTLQMNNNNITSAIPSDFDKLVALATLNLSFNHFHSSIPDFFDDAPLMWRLSLQNNNLSGSLPPSFATLNNIQSVDLSNNSLTGTFPLINEPGNLIYLRTINISNNYFDGFVDYGNSYLYTNVNATANKLDFGDIEPNFITANSSIFKNNITQLLNTFAYVPQANPIGTVRTVNVVEGTTLTIDYPMPGAAHNVYEWQRKDGSGNWVTIQATSPNNYVVQGASQADVGTYRCIITNTWVTDLTFTTREIKVRLVPPLCDSALPVSSGSFKMDKLTGAIVFDRTDCSADIPLFCIYGPPKISNNVVASSVSTFSDDWESGAISGQGTPSNNPFLNGTRGKWRPQGTYVYRTDINYQANDKNYSAGTYTFKPFNWKNGDRSMYPGWLKSSWIERYSPDGEVIQESNALGIAAAAKFGYRGTVPYAVAKNATYETFMFESFENTYNSYLEDGVPVTGGSVVTTDSHSGKSSFNLTGAFGSSVFSITDKIREKGFQCRFWASGDISASTVNIQSSAGTAGTLTRIASVGNWSLWESNIDLTETDDGEMTITVNKIGGNTILIDDVRVQPFDAQMSCYVYDARTFQLLATFDDQHFGLFFQYNVDGKLTRKQMETVRGLKTVQETQYNSPVVSKNSMPQN